MIGNEEGTGDTSTLNPAPLGPPKNPSRNGYTPPTHRYNPKPMPRNENLSTISSGHPHSCLKTRFSDAFVNAWAERSCSQMCSRTADFADVRECSPVSKSLVALRIRSLANCGEHAAGNWGSRGRRFKSCHPDGKQQVRGRFGQNPRRPLCCRVATV